MLVPVQVPPWVLGEGGGGCGRGRKGARPGGDVLQGERSRPGCFVVPLPEARLVYRVNDTATKEVPL